ncbi:hypothetical protein FQN57_000042 [Myotisia sp. PD_48]|nr:hypothetical protein FQN57_000042 [Myotisia sp. PD_48]
MSAVSYAPSQHDTGYSTSCEFVGSSSSLPGIIDMIYEQPVSPPSLYLDLEGIRLSRHGSISILQIYVSPEKRTYLIDIHVLGHEAFTVAGSNGKTLKTILESPTISKVFFDVRRDSDALYSHFGISLSGVLDLQLMEVASRNSDRSYLHGLSQCVERDAGLSRNQKEQWKLVKDRGIKLFDPQRGGTYDVFNERPLSQDIRKYCTQDVRYMPMLWSVYSLKLTSAWAKKVHEETNNRIVLSQSATFNCQGPRMARSPW